MGKKNRKKTVPIETVYIAPPKDVKTVEVEYDPKTKVTDPFEDDLNCLLQTTAYTTVEGPISSQSKPQKKISKNIEEVNHLKKSASSQKPKITKKTKKEILDFDITFSSDEETEEEEEEEEERENKEDVQGAHMNRSKASGKRDHINRGTKPKSSEAYLAKELGLNSSDTDIGFSSTDGEEDFDLADELYEKLNIEDFNDAVIGELLNEDSDEDQEVHKEKRKPKTKKPKAPNDVQSAVPHKENNEAKKKRPKRKSGAEKRRLKREAAGINSVNEAADDSKKVNSRAEPNDVKRDQPKPTKPKNNNKDIKSKEAKAPSETSPKSDSKDPKPKSETKPIQPKWASDAAKNGSLRKKKESNKKTDDGYHSKRETFRLKTQENWRRLKGKLDGEKPPATTRSQLINQESASKKENVPQLDSKKPPKKSKKKVTGVPKKVDTKTAEES